jgi:type I restriction enzyme S subunit
MFMAASYAGHKLCQPGDLVINTMWAWMGALGVAEETGIVSPSYGVYRPLPGTPLLPVYANLLLRTRPYVDEYTCRSTGIRASRLRLYPDRFLTIPIVCPPVDEQEAIVARVLDATTELNAAIDSAALEIQLLEEYRGQVVHEVISGGRDVRPQAVMLSEVDRDELDGVLTAVLGLDDVAGEDEG